VRDAYQWYEARQYGLGNRFLNEVITCSEKIGKDNIEYREYIRGIRYGQLIRFPFFIFFFKEGLKAFMLAVLHQRQDILRVTQTVCRPKHLIWLNNS
jgi:toxin ParE1/3/4